MTGLDLAFNQIGIPCISRQPKSQISSAVHKMSGICQAKSSKNLGLTITPPHPSKISIYPDLSHFKDFHGPKLSILRALYLAPSELALPVDSVVKPNYYYLCSMDAKDDFLVPRLHNLGALLTHSRTSLPFSDCFP